MSASKKELRALVSKLKKQHTRAELQAESESIAARLQACPLFSSARTVLLYYSLPDEPDTHKIISEASKSKTIVLPVVTGDTTMELRVYSGEDSLAQGAFNIMEPQGAPFEDISSIDLAVIPGVAFDKKGNRLGRGKGYFDRFLADLKRAGVPTIGVCFSFQKFDTIPAEPHDIAVDQVL